MELKTCDMWEVTDNDFKIIEKWGLEEEPFKAVSDFSERKKELRWLNPEHRDQYVKYIYDRFGYIGNKNFDNYYKTAEKPIDQKRWKYLMKRKAWFIMPLGWDRIAEIGGNVADFGCGDGDTVQRLIDFIEKYWSQKNIQDKKIHIIGLDLNASRIENAKKYVKSNNQNITFEFQTIDISGEGLKYEKNYFDFGIITGVIEILEDSVLDYFLDEVCKTISRGLFIEDLFEKFPGGIPRDNIDVLLSKRKFKVKKRHIILSEPFDVDKLQDPMKLWPIMLDQNIWAERN